MAIYPMSSLIIQTVAQLTSLGFDSQRVMAVLTRVNGNVERAVQVRRMISFIISLDVFERERE